MKFEFLYNSYISAKFWQHPASIDREEQNKFCQKIDLVGIEPKIT